MDQLNFNRPTQEHKPPDSSSDAPCDILCEGPMHPFNFLERLTKSPQRRITWRESFQFLSFITWERLIAFLAISAFILTYTSGSLSVVQLAALMNLTATTFALVYLRMISFGAVFSENSHARKLSSSGRKHLNRSVSEEQLLNSQSINWREDYASLSGKGTSRKIYYQFWGPVESESTNAIVIWVHGMNSYGGKIAHLVPRFLAHNIAVCCLDLPGFGRSDGLHGYIQDMNVQYAAVEAIVDLMRVYIRNERLSAKLFLAGPSMGGLIALQYCRTHPISVDGLLLLAPAICNDKIDSNPVIRYATRLLVACFPKILYSLPLLPQMRFRYILDQAILKDLERDSQYYHGKIRFGTAKSLLLAMDDLQAHLHEIQTPFIVIHGDLDLVIPLKGTKALYEKALSRNKQMMICRGYDHYDLLERLDEFGRSNLDVLINWMEEFPPTKKI